MNELSIFAAAREEPTGDCLVADGRRLSFAEVASQVGRAIGTLQSQGVEAGQKVAIAPAADVDSAVWLYALFELGCPAVLLHPRLTERERFALLLRADVTHLIAEPAPTGTASEPALHPVAEERTLAIVYTSGSRGEPRGARLSRRAFLASERAHASNLGWRVDDRWLLAMPPAHIGGLSILTRCLIARRCVVLSPGPFDPAGVGATIERDAVTLVSFVPTMLRRLLESSEPAWMPPSRLRAVLVGGAPFSIALREQAVARGVPALATYGCTEACSQVATQQLSEAGQPGCGRPLRGIELRIEDGEIQLRGDTLMDGYLAEGQDVEPWTDDGWLRTGDLGEYTAFGQLLVRGRLDDLIITGGENVAPQEVETWLESVPGIVSAAVFGLPDQKWGARVVAAIVTEDPAYDLAQLRRRLHDELAAHKRPKQVCVLDALPLNRSGKVDRREVAARCEGLRWSIL